MFDLALNDVCSGWSAVVPPNRVSVSRGAEQCLVIKRPGGSGGPWSPTETPYMVEPVDTLGSRRHSAVVFCGSSQSGKTVSLGEGWLAHAAVNDPGDMLIVQMTQDKAREYKKQRLDRAFRNSPKLKAVLTSHTRDNNLHDMALRNGMMVRIAWPTATNLSSSSYRYVFGTDYDRWPADIDGEGDGFTLMGKRITTFLSRGMVAVESSPGWPVTDPTWQPATAHEAPPVEGVLGIYNRSDRRRWYWKCPHCGDWLEASPGLGLFRLPDDDTLLEDVRGLDIDKFARQYARVPCPHCGAHITPGHREAMNLGGRWLVDGLVLDDTDRVSGTARTSTIAGFWLGGGAATYISWESLIRKHVQALLEYQLNGSELPLQTTANTDQCMPYTSRHLAEAARSAAMGDRTDASLQRFIVPAWARFLVASVDVQGGKNARFVVQVHAVGEHKRQALVDRYAITESDREGPDGGKAPIDPAAHPDDWDVLTRRIVQATYRTAQKDMEMRVWRTMVDSGGEEGVTDKAYAWWRRLRARGDGLHNRVRLIKGASTKVEWHMRESMVGGVQGKGDVPLLLLDPNKFKDMVSAGLSRREPGPGYYHWPTWLPPSFFDELHAEVRDANGVWRQIKTRNESFDLCYMILAGCMIVGADKREFWTAPPTWALPQDSGNSEMITPELRRAEQAAPARLERKVRRSNYMQ